MNVQQIQERFSKPLLRIFISYYRPHLKLFILDMACALFIALVDLSFPMISRYALQDILPAGRLNFFFVLMIAVVIAYVLRSVAQYVVTYWGHLLGVRMEVDMREDLFTHLQRLSFKFYDKHRTGHLMSRVVSDLFDVVELAHHGPEDLFIASITLIGSFTLMMTIRWELALLLLILMPVIVWLTIRARRNMSKASLKVREETAGINADIESSISGVRVAQAFTNEQYEIERFTSGNYKYRDAKGLYYRAMASFSSSMGFMTAILQVVVIGVGGYFVSQGRMNLVDLIAFNLYVASFVTPINKLVSFFEQYTNGMAGFSRFVELMLVKPEIEDSPNAKSIDPDTVEGEITFEHVSFSYREELPVLNNLSLQIKAGETIALVGPSGGGKTTISQLIPRFYEISEGSIKLDGEDIRDLKLDDLRAQVGIVQQEVFLFADSIKNNIRYGRLDATDEEIVEAARRADIHDFIMGLPQGYSTIVGERGATLSGGQKQRVSIARIFLKNPPVILLDEATSALDTATEVRIQAALDELSEGRTSLVIAHRLSTIKNADRIFYIDDGEIIDEGTHDALLAKGGPYAELYEAQFKLQEGEAVTLK